MYSHNETSLFLTCQVKVKDGQENEGSYRSKRAKSSVHIAWLSSSRGFLHGIYFLVSRLFFFYCISFRFFFSFRLSFVWQSFSGVSLLASFEDFFFFTVSSPFNPYRATLALNVGLCFLRSFDISHSSSRQQPLSVILGAEHSPTHLSEFPCPPQKAGAGGASSQKTSSR